jgi:gamma-glutamylcyclotransferase (GGCT)/AIG2-like uncharacterized protein YtfP
LPSAGGLGWRGTELSGYGGGMRLYFGYGSNLDAVDFNRWCGEHGYPPAPLTALTMAWLPDWSLAFDHRSVRRAGGTLNIRRSIGEAVPGVVFEASVGDWAALAHKEGYGSGVHYGEVETIAIDPVGDEIKVATFESARPEQAPISPADGYLDVVQRGYRAHGLPEAGLLAAAGVGPPNATHVFVYGSLKRGGWLSHQLAPHLLEARDATIQGDLYDLGDYPGYRAGTGIVHGDLCRVRDVKTLLERLDEVERFGGYGVRENLYRRVLVRTDPEGVWAWAYQLVSADAGGPLLPEGRWPIGA